MHFIKYLRIYDKYLLKYKVTENNKFFKKQLIIKPRT